MKRSQVMFSTFLSSTRGVLLINSEHYVETFTNGEVSKTGSLKKKKKKKKKKTAFFLSSKRKLVTRRICIHTDERNLDYRWSDLPTN
ncbi:hypothetical protein OK016_09135 [Vibrio chagasii]|nr:hypothetical protein [Vibrio chagasii]